jgi:hypothetical protein
VQQWERYVSKGGTVAAWRMQNAVREQQVADLREAVRTDV